MIPSVSWLHSPQLGTFLWWYCISRHWRGSRARSLQSSALFSEAENLHFERMEHYISKRWNLTPELYILNFGSLTQEPCTLKRLSLASELEVGWSLIFYRGGFWSVDWSVGQWENLKRRKIVIFQKFWMRIIKYFDPI